MPANAKTVTRVELTDAVYRRIVGLTRTKLADLVDLVLKEITDTIARGEAVKLSSFGTFTVRKKGQRVGRNPKTGVEVPIVPRRVAVFKASAIMKRKIQNNSGSDARNDTTAPNVRSVVAEPLSWSARSERDEHVNQQPLPPKEKTQTQRS